MITGIVRRVRKAPVRWWRRLRKGARHRAHRREAGLTKRLSSEDCYAWAIEAYEIALDAEGIPEAEEALARLFLPLDEVEMTRVAITLASLTRTKMTDTRFGVEWLRFQIAHWESAE